MARVTADTALRRTSIKHHLNDQPASGMRDHHRFVQFFSVRDRQRVIEGSLERYGSYLSNKPVIFSSRALSENSCTNLNHLYVVSAASRGRLEREKNGIFPPGSPPGRVLDICTPLNYP